MTSPAAASVRAYSQAWWDTPGLETSVCSPLGAWLLLAQLSTLPAGARLAGVLHTPAARELADQLLTHPHPALKSALALWSRDHVLNDLGRSYIAGLPGHIATGPMPDQVGADRWADLNTDGMIQKFPIAITPSTALVLASALATDVSWEDPYDIVPADDLGGPFGNQVSHCLARAGLTGLFDTRAAGRVAATFATSVTGIRVVSVIAAEDVPPSAVHAAAQELLALGNDWYASALSLGSVPLGDGHAWTLSEEEGTHDYSKVLLPAWTARTEAADITLAPGVHDGLAVLASLSDEPLDTSAAQSAFAEYTSTGFKAAAVTAFDALGRAMRQMEPIRRLTVRFNRPYMVVAETTSTVEDRSGWPPQTKTVSDPLWDGIPVFSAWVTTPMEGR